MCASNLFMNWQREGGRPPIPRKKPLKDMEKEPLVSDHPFVDTVFYKKPNHMPLTARLGFYTVLYLSWLAFFYCHQIVLSRKFLPFFQLWEWHNAEQMILDYEEQNPDKFKDTTYESTVDASSFDEENRVEYTEGYFKETRLKKKVVVCNLV